MQEMVKGFNFRLAGRSTVNGHECYVLTATPRARATADQPRYEGADGHARQMWIDTRQYQWVKVHAEVFRPVAFGLFIAHVSPAPSSRSKNRRSATASGCRRACDEGPRHNVKVLVA